MFASNDTRDTRTIPPSAATMARPKTRCARRRANASTGSTLGSNLERVIPDRHVQGDVVQRDRLLVAARKGHLHLDEQRAFTVNPEDEPLESFLDLFALR